MTSDKEIWDFEMINKTPTKIRDEKTIENEVETEVNQLQERRTFTSIVLFHKAKLCTEYVNLHDLQKIRISLMNDIDDLDKITYADHIHSIDTTIKGYGGNWDQIITSHQFRTINKKLYEASMFMTPVKGKFSYNYDEPNYFQSASWTNRFKRSHNLSKKEVRSNFNTMQTINATERNTNTNASFINPGKHGHFKYAHELQGYSQKDFIKDKEIPIFDDEGNIIAFEEGDVIKKAPDPIFRENPTVQQPLLYNQYEVNGRVYTVKIPKQKIDVDSPLKGVVELLFNLGRNTLSSETNIQVSNFLKEQQETISEISDCFPEYKDLNIEINTCLVAHGWKLGSGFQSEPNRKSLFNALNIICGVYLP